jgi:hypothetical protein
MRALLPCLLSLTAVACAHLDRAQLEEVTVYRVMDDREIARVAVLDALGELHEVQAVDAARGVVTRGRPAFRSREERLDFDRRVDGLLRARIYGQGPALELLRLRCEAALRGEWGEWRWTPSATRRACDPSDVAVTLHSLYRKPRLQRAYVEVLLGVVDDAAFAQHARERLAQLSDAELEPYHFELSAWERLEGFRPRG